jgi:hypothetical protein
MKPDRLRRTKDRLLIRLPIIRHHYTFMNIMRFLPAMCFLLLVGCKSDHPVSSVIIPDQSHPVVSVSPISTTNTYYMIDKGPGCAIFLKQSDVDAFFGPRSEGRLVTVVDGHFPPPTQVAISPTITVSQSHPPLDYNKRDMSLIDDTGTK